MTAPIERLDVPVARLEANIARRAVERHVASLPEPQLPECLHCGDRHGPWVSDPSGARYPSGAQVLVCSSRCTAADLDRHALDLDADTAFARLAANWSTS